MNMIFNSVVLIINNNWSDTDECPMYWDKN